MRFCCDGGEGEFSEGFGNTDYCFELTDCDGDAGADWGFEFGGVDLFADGDEMGGEFFGGGGGETGRASSLRADVSF